MVMLTGEIKNGENSLKRSATSIHPMLSQVTQVSNLIRNMNAHRYPIPDCQRVTRQHTYIDSEYKTTFASVEKTLSETRFILPCISILYIYIHTSPSLSLSLSLVVTKSIIFLPSNPFITNALSKDKLFHKCYFKKNIATTKTTKFLGGSPRLWVLRSG